MLKTHRRIVLDVWYVGRNHPNPPPIGGGFGWFNLDFSGSPGFQWICRWIYLDLSESAVGLAGVTLVRTDSRPIAGVKQFQMFSRARVLRFYAVQKCFIHP
jgi:hypothetical protein